MKEFKINDFISLRLEKVESELETVIYVGRRVFGSCKYLILQFPCEEIPLLDDVNSIDDIPDVYEHNGNFEISPEEEFWGHCSNLQVWAEHDYDTRLIRHNLAFHLLKELKQCGDPKAKKVFKEEIAKRLIMNNENLAKYLVEEGFILNLNKNEFRSILPDLSVKMCSIIKNSMKKKWANDYLSVKKRNRIYELLKTLVNDLKSVSIEDERFIVHNNSLNILAHRKIQNLSEIKYLKKYAKNIEKLEITHNNLKSIKGIKDFNNLKKLNLSENQIETIEELKFLPQLEDLDLSNNKITDINSLIHLKELKRLILHNNNISNVPNFRKLKHIEYLDLRSNQIKNIEGLDELKKLKFLILAQNKIKPEDIKIPENLDHFSS